MEKVRKIILLPLLILALNTQAQDSVFIVLIKGNACVKFNGSDKQRNLLENNRLLLSPYNSLVISANSSAIVYNEKSKIQIGSPSEEKYQTISIIESLKKEEAGSITRNFYKYMNRMYSQMKINEGSEGTVVGAVNRGQFDWMNLLFSPVDSALILSDTLELVWGNGANRLVGNLVIINETSKDLIYNSIPEGSRLLLRYLSPGRYSWRYGLVEKGKSKVINYHNEFFIPSVEQKQIFLSDYEDFIKEISDLGPEVKTQLISHYLSQNRYYFHVSK
jgi:hypothetical protein